MRRVVVVAVSVAVVASVGGAAPSGADSGSGGTYRPDEINKVRVPDGSGGWTEKDCSVFPIDNVWHSLVGDLDPIVDLAAPNWGTASDLVLHPRFAEASDYFDQNLQRLPANGGHGVNVISSDEPDRRFLINRDLEHTTEWNQRTPVLWTFDYFVRHEAPPLSSLKWQDMAWGVPFMNAPDNHMYFIDVHANRDAFDKGASCVGYEYIGFNPTVSGGGTYKVDHGIAFDLGRNTRRLSAELASDASYPLPISFGAGYANQVRKVRNTKSAQGGSGLSGLAGMIRVDEVFANSTPGDETVRTTGGIDHALGAVLPQSLIRSKANGAFGLDAWTWPATDSDGLATDSGVPMGSRLRLKASECVNLATTFEEEPQAQIIARAMCDHGVIVVDSSRLFGLYGEMSDKWDSAQLGALNAFNLSDFEIVDATPMRQVTGGEDCRTNWSDLVPAATPKPCNQTNWLAVK